MIGNAPLSIHTGVPGWETPAEQDLLFRLAGDVPKKGVIVEIGCEYGMSASLLLAGSHRSVRVNSIDNFDEAAKQTFMNNLAEAGLGGRSSIMQADSYAAGMNWPNIPIDLLFIDGDHTFEGVQRDIEAWVPKVKVGGRVIFHDCACATNTLPHPLHFEVTRAVMVWVQQTTGWILKEMVDTCMVFQFLGDWSEQNDLS